MKLKAKYCLVFLSPALVLSTASVPQALACACILLVSGIGAAGAARLFKSCSIFAAIMAASALSLGGELIATAAFPNSFEGYPTLALTGAACFFAASFAINSRNAPFKRCACLIAASSLLTALLGAVRALLFFVPLAEKLPMGFILAGIAVALISFALPLEKVMTFTMKQNADFALALACTFLLCDTVYVVSAALWNSVQVSFLLCVLSAFVFSAAARWMFLPRLLSYIPSCAVLLVLVQPESTNAVEIIIYALITAAGAITAAAVLAAVVRRMELSDTPKQMRGMPIVLVILGLGALAFGGF